MTSALQSDIERWRLVRQLVRGFEIDFDVPVFHEQAIGLLMLLGATATPADDHLVAIAGYVGAATARIIGGDVAYRYLDALDALANSGAQAELLRQHIARGALGPEDHAHATYVLARWTDAAARIDYRLGDFASAVKRFDAALGLAEAGGHWSCLADIRSNRIRADFEQRRSAGATVGNMVDDYAKLRDQELARAASLPAPAEWNGARDGAPPEPWEHWRGVCNVHHNHSIALEMARALDESLRASEASSAIARALGDDYRLAQALTHQGRLLFDRRRLDESEDRFREVASSTWVRGHRIARQWLGRIAGERGDFEAAKRIFSDFFDSFARERGARDVEIGTDVTFQSHTVNYFEAVLTAAGGARQADELVHLRRVARRERLRAVRAFRRVVKVAAYKREYARSVQPTYRSEAAQRLAEAASLKGARNREKWLDSVLLLAEEATARELLDLMAASGAAGADPFDEVFAADGDAPEPEDEGAREAVDGAATAAPPAPHGPPRRATARRRGREADDEGDDLRRDCRSAPLATAAIEAIEERRLAYEQAALQSLVATLPINPEIAHALRQFTGDEDRRVVIRYLYADHDKKDADHGKERRLYAYVARDGRASVHGPLDTRALSELTAAWDTAKGPSVALARAIFTALFAPLWDELGVDVPEGQRPPRLVVIPTDELFDLPLHVALGDETGMVPIAARLPLCFSVSVAAHVERGRHRCARFTVDDDDDLFAFMDVDGRRVSGGEVVGIGWHPRKLHISGRAPAELAASEYTAVREVGEAALARLAEERPEFFLYAGHGDYDPARAEVGPLLTFPGLTLTQFDVAHRVHLPRNKLAILAACVSGRGARAGGGEVAGFLRALMAAGAGALGVTLWSVLDREIVPAVGSLLAGAVEKRGKKGSGSVHDVVSCLYDYYRETSFPYRDPTARIEELPLALYL